MTSPLTIGLWGAVLAGAGLRPGRTALPLVCPLDASGAAAIPLHRVMTARLMQEPAPLCGIA